MLPEPIGDPNGGKYSFLGLLIHNFKAIFIYQQKEFQIHLSCLKNDHTDASSFSANLFIINVYPAK